MSAPAPAMVVSVLRDRSGRARCLHAGFGATVADVEPTGAEFAGWVPTRIATRAELEAVLAEPHTADALPLLRSFDARAAMGSVGTWAALVRQAFAALEFGGGLRSVVLDEHDTVGERRAS